MHEDPRCCGGGVCIINADGDCWCGQKWNGSKMAFPARDLQPAAVAAPSNAEDRKKAKLRRPKSDK